MIYLAFVSIFLLGIVFGSLLTLSVFNFIVSNRTVNKTVTKAVRRNINPAKPEERGAILEPKKELNEIYEQFFSEWGSL